MARKYFGKRMLPPMPSGGYDLTDAVPSLVEARKPKKTAKKNQEFVQADGGDARMHAIMLGKDDQFITVIKAVPVKD